MAIEGLGPKGVSGSGPLGGTRAADKIFSEKHNELSKSPHMERAKDLQVKDHADGSPLLHKAWAIIFGRAL